MKYGENNCIGDAGEHYFSYKIIDELQSPCRLQNIDIGIDAVIELIGSNEESISEFIYVQIKSSKNKLIKHRISLRHLLYWNSIKYPVIIAGVSLSTKDIYIINLNDKNIFEDLKYRAFKSKNKEVSISFNTYKNSELLEKYDYSRFSSLRFKKIENEFTDLLFDLDISSEHILKYKDVDCIEKFYKILMDEPVSREEVYNFIISLDRILYTYPLIENIIDDYRVPNYVIYDNEVFNKPLILKVQNILKNTKKCLKLVEDLADYMSEYISLDDFRIEIFDNYFKNDDYTIKTPTAKKLFDSLLS